MTNKCHEPWKTSDFRDKKVSRPLETGYLRDKKVSRPDNLPDAIVPRWIEKWQQILPLIVGMIAIRIVDCDVAWHCGMYIARECRRSPLVLSGRFKPNPLIRTYSVGGRLGSDGEIRLSEGVFRNFTFLG